MRKKWEKNSRRPHPYHSGMKKVQISANSSRYYYCNQGVWIYVFQKRPEMLRAKFWFSDSLKYTGYLIFILPSSTIFIFFSSALCIHSIVLSEELPHQYFFDGRSKVQKFNKICNLLRHPPIDSSICSYIYTIWVKIAKICSDFAGFHSRDIKAGT